MVSRVKSEVTYSAAPRQETPLSDKNLFIQSNMRYWLAAIINTRGLKCVEFAGLAQIDGLEKHVEQRARAAIGTCDAPEGCKIDVELPGIAQGIVEESTLALHCPLMGYLSEEAAVAAEARCMAHYGTAPENLELHINKTVSEHRAAAEANRATVEALAAAEQRL